MTTPDAPAPPAAHPVGRAQLLSLYTDIYGQVRLDLSMPKEEWRKVGHPAQSEGRFYLTVGGATVRDPTAELVEALLDVLADVLATGESLLSAFVHPTHPGRSAFDGRIYKEHRDRARESLDRARAALAAYEASRK